MSVSLILLLVVTSLALNPPTCYGSNISIGGLFATELGGRYWENEALSAARIAVLNINGDSTILSGVKLTLNLVDTSIAESLCTISNVSTQSIAAVKENLLRSTIEQEINRSKPVAMIGPAFTNETKMVTRILDSHGVLLMGYSSDDTAFSDKSLYPLYSRVCPSVADSGKALADIAELLKIRSCQIIVENSHAYSDISQSFQAAVLGKVRIEKNYTWNFGNETELKVLVRNFSRLSMLSTNVFLFMSTGSKIAFFNEVELIQVSDEYSWLSTDFDVPLNAKHLPDSYIGISYQANTTTAAFQKLQSVWTSLPSSSYPGLEQLASNVYISAAYDAVYAVAHALDVVVRSDAEQAWNSTAMLGALSQVKFEGASGYISFNSNNDLGVTRFVINSKSGQKFFSLGVWTSTAGVQVDGQQLQSILNGKPESYINVGGIFQYWSREHAAAALVAIERINRNVTLLPQIKLFLQLQNITPVRAIPPQNYLKTFFFEAVMNNLTDPPPGSAPVMAAAGVGYSNDVEVFSPMFTQDKRLLVSHTAASPAFSNKALYPFFSRVCYSSAVEAIALADLTAYIEATSIKLITCDDSYCQGLANNFKSRVKTNSVKIADELVLATAESSFVADNNGVVLMQNFATKTCNTTVIVLCIHYYIAQEIFIAFNKLNLTSNFTWIAGEDVSTADPSLLPKGILSLRSYIPDPSPQLDAMINFWKQLDVSGYDTVMQQNFKSGLQEMINRGQQHIYIVFAYDAIYAIAHAIGYLLSQGNVILDGTQVRNALRSVRFDGASGAVSFDQNLDRLGGSYLVINYAKEGWKEIARWYSNEIHPIYLESLPYDKWLQDAVMWPGGQIHINRSICSLGASQSNSSMILVVSLLAAALAICSLMSFGLWYSLVQRRKNMTDGLPKRFRKQIEYVRHRLCLTEEDGFLLNSEKKGFFDRRKGVQTIEKRFLEACAHFSLFEDFEAKHVDALYEFLSELRDGLHKRETPSLSRFSMRRLSTGVGSDAGELHLNGVSHEEYVIHNDHCKLLHDFVLETCQKLLRPTNSFHDNDEAQQEPQGYDLTLELSSIASEDGEIASSLRSSELFTDDFERRFAFFVENVLKMNMWKEQGMDLFHKLKGIIQKLLDILAHFCHIRYMEIYSDPYGKELIARTGYLTSNYDDTRQDSPAIGAVRVSEEDLLELEFQKHKNLFHSSTSGLLMSNETNFVSQLHTRAELLDLPFKKRVYQILMQHSSIQDLPPPDFSSVVHLTCAFSDGVSSVDLFPGRIKTRERMHDKLSKYTNEAYKCSWPYCARILDPIRVSVVCEGPQYLLEVYRWFSAPDTGMPICRVKNKFDPGYLSDGYRDLTLCVVFTDDLGLRIIAEIQLHDKRIHDLKLKMHRLYKVKRADTPDVK
ncbi:hypothetical protein GUITHDRAFT_121912 [Guillardia theta CCMP2712]|uniref:Receptor ligand binding region domain-containing protein n=2 Tax=Guillardia theta TaxID=55529 RepID=L1I6N0_GUITC|nr:hypothetical protein GUITHDRAFT_121912 [Guillardia theta CCMP2712]EKX31913.1 hypothetical protein GUITHDRAFT_121912 [Guillardia theta CCMP2712]|eukprot:XP_005818893.1 hypothetical protein GUITHDRAFT_121912 [Guillardia theta CCMP2712]